MNTLKNGSVSKIEECPWAICVFGGHGSRLTYTIMKAVLKSVIILFLCIIVNKKP